MASVAFALPVLPGQGETVRRMSEMVSDTGALRETYEESRRRLGITEEKVWLQSTPIGEAVVVYWEVEDPQRVLREVADSQDEFDRMFRQFIETSAPAIDLNKEHPLSNELLFAWRAS
jgi:hypothetical protein